MAKQSQAKEITERETPINAPVSFVIMLMAKDTEHAINIYDDLIARGVQPKQINYQPQHGAQVARTASPAVGEKGQWERKYIEAFGKLVEKPYMYSLLRSNGFTVDNREQYAQVLLTVRSEGRLERKPGRNGVFFDGVFYPTSGEAGVPSVAASSVNAGDESAPDMDIDLDECV